MDACVILAAGQGSRLGGRNKALLPFGDQSFLSAIVERCRNCRVKEIVVIVAQPHMKATVEEAHRLGVRDTVCNETPERGMASSVALGFEFAQANFRSSYAWLWPVDSPGISVESMKMMSESRSDSEILIPSFGGRGGHPALVSQSIWSELAACVAEPEGARTVFRRHHASVMRIPLSDPRVCLDVDHIEDLEEYS